MKRYETPSTWRALWQLTNSTVLYSTVWYLMLKSMEISYWLLPPLWLVAGGICVRMFIINHDCGHGSFLKSRLANTLIGRVTAFLVFTPYEQWRHSHAVHHKTSGKLDGRRLEYDIWTMSTDMYAALSEALQFGYRLNRHHILFFFVGPISYLLLALRQVHNKGLRYRQSVYTTNILWLIVFALMSYVFSWKTVALTVLPTFYCFGVIAFWFFYVQHQYEFAYWEDETKWNFFDAATKGSSYYKLPKIFQWFTGNIGFHHVHHLSSRIPNYHLERCHKENPELFGTVPALYFWKSLRYARVSLWDRESQRMISFQEYEKKRTQVCS